MSTSAYPITTSFDNAFQFDILSEIIMYESIIKSNDGKIVKYNGR